VVCLWRIYEWWPSLVLNLVLLVLCQVHRRVSDNMDRIYLGTIVGAP